MVSWRGVSYDKRDSTVREVGLIAQDVEKDCPEAIFQSPRTFDNGETIEDLRGVNVAGVTAAYTIEAMKQVVDLLDLVLNDPAQAAKRIAALKAAINRSSES
jgi:hypothetical protein